MNLMIGKVVFKDVDKAVSKLAVMGGGGGFSPFNLEKMISS